MMTNAEPKMHQHDLLATRERWDFDAPASASPGVDRVRPDPATSDFVRVAPSDAGVPYQIT